VLVVLLPNELITACQAAGMSCRARTVLSKQVVDGCSGWYAREWRC
jgi:hypothetical protein